VLGRVGEAYFQMLNESGGINGRKIKFFTMDDAYSAPKCVEATRRLVEQEEVLALFGSLGTAPQTAVHKYLNSKACRSFCSTPAPRSGTIRRTTNGPWRSAALSDRSAHPRQACGEREAECEDRHPLPERRFRPRFPGAFKKVLADAGGTASVIMEQTYDLTEPTVDSSSSISRNRRGRFLQHHHRKATSQSIRKVAELGWKPLQLLSRLHRPLDPQCRRLRECQGHRRDPLFQGGRTGRWEKDKDAMAFEALRAKYLPLSIRQHIAMPAMVRRSRWAKSCAAAATI